MRKFKTSCYLYSITYITEDGEIGKVIDIKPFVGRKERRSLAGSEARGRKKVSGRREKKNPSRHVVVGFYESKEIGLEAGREPL